MIEELMKLLSACYKEMVVFKPIFMNEEDGEIHFASIFL